MLQTDANDLNLLNDFERLERFNRLEWFELFERLKLFEPSFIRNGGFYVFYMDRESVGGCFF